MERPSRSAAAAHAFSAARVSKRAARNPLRGRGHGLGAAIRHADRPADRQARGGRAGLSEGSLVWRVRVRLGLGRRVQAQRLALLPEASVRRAVHARARQSAAVRRRARAAASRGHTDGIRRAGRCVLAARAVSDRSRSGCARRHGHDATRRRAVSLAQRRLPRLRRFPLDARTEEAQEHPRGTPQSTRGRRHDAQDSRRRHSGRRLALLQQVLSANLSRALFDSVSEPRLFPHDRRVDAGESAARDRRI